MATLSTNQITVAGILNVQGVMVACAGGGDKVRPGPSVFCELSNGGGAPITCTIDDPLSRTPVGAVAFNPDVAVVVTNAQRSMFGPLTSDRFAGLADGLAALTYSAVTSCTIGAFAV